MTICLAVELKIITEYKNKTATTKPDKTLIKDVFIQNIRMENGNNMFVCRKNLKFLNN